MRIEKKVGTGQEEVFLLFSSEYILSLMCYQEKNVLLLDQQECLEEYRVI